MYRPSTVDGTVLEDTTIRITRESSIMFLDPLDFYLNFRKLGSTYFFFLMEFFTSSRTFEERFMNFMEMMIQCRYPHVAHAHPQSKDLLSTNVEL